MEGEVSGIAKLGIVLIALAVLIGLGFGIFQISKGTANTGVNDVQKELDGVSTSQYTTYDQTTITGQMVRSAVQDFEGEQVAIAIATQAWVNLINESGIANKAVLGHDGAGSAGICKSGSAFSQYYSNNADVPVLVAYAKDPVTDGVAVDWTNDNTYKMNPTKQGATTAYGAFINYNAILGNKEKTATGVNANQAFKYYGLASTNEGAMAYIYFDTNCFRCTSGFLADDAGKVQYSNITKNLAQSGTTEFIPTGAKFSSYLIKDASGTIQGIACQQIGQ